ncbi:integrating conjugative element protein [Luteimonas sp. XNQY3]|nr:integrating conjugative element protein [Luteimonas sp. XNQY3]MCD9007467.1 integrating conjugative element protein [Luteimonas sp. XNQY3]
MKRHHALLAAAAALSASLLLVAPAFAQPASLIVVEDRGGPSALPYYAALDLQPPGAQDAPAVERPAPTVGRVGEADMLPVRSRSLAPGAVQRRTIQAPGLTPVFLIGDDARSRAWLRERGTRLRDLNAVGLVVNVESADALTDLRALAPGLMLSPASGDDMAMRLGLQHYPVLITATSVEQ